MNGFVFMSALLTVGCSLASAPIGGGNLPKSIYQFKMDNIDGKPTNLAAYKGKVLLIVNVASKCGNTPQYAALEDLYKKYKSQGLVILGFPANDFLHQEPGTNEEIKQFCTATYGVSFPMFSKIEVKGPEIDPLYQWLIAHSDRPKDDIEWNFAKFVIDRDGNEVARILPQIKPDDPKVLDPIQAALADKK